MFLGANIFKKMLISFFLSTDYCSYLGIKMGLLCGTPFERKIIELSSIFREIVVQGIILPFNWFL
jgi:hypothetical protein